MKILVLRFDVDKLFVARYALDKKGKKIQFESKEEYENRLRELGFADEDIARMSYSRYNVNELQQSREAYQNMLLDMCIASISNPLQYAESKQPLDAVTSYLTGKILKDIDNLSGNVEENVADQIYYASPSFQNKTKDDLISGKSHLGVFALAASHHSLSQMVGLTFNRSAHLDKYPIFSLSKINSNTPNYWDKDASIYTLVSDWISAMINAHVDVAKDPYINRLNIRTLTLQMTSLLLRSGVGEPTFYFLAQPILVEAAKEFEKVSGYYGAEKISRRELLNRIKDKYYSKIQELGGNASQLRFDLMRPLPSSYTTTKLFNIEYLRDIMPKKESAEWYINQLYILKAFEELQPFAQALSELTTISQIDTKKYGNNFALQQQFLMKLADFLLKNKAIANPENIFRDTFLKEKLRVALINPRNVFSNSLVRVTRDFENRRAKIYSLIAGLGSESLNDSLVNSVTRVMESNYKLNAIVSYARNNGIRARDLMYGENSIARRLVKIKRLIQSGEFPELLRSDGRFENALLDNIDAMLKTTPVDFVLPDFLVYKQNKSADGNVDDQIIRAWEELLDFDTEVESKKEDAKEIRKFARDLAVYAMYTSGDAFGKNNIFKFVPNSFRETSGYFDSIRSVESDISNYLQNLDDNNTIRNLWWNDDVVPAISLYQTTYDETGVPERTIRDGVGAGYSIGNTSVLGLITLDRNETKFLYKNSSNQPIYQLYIKINYGERNDPRTTKLYKFAGLQKETIQRGDSTYENFKPVYKLVTKKGLNFKGKTFVENIGTENSPSVITINNENFEIDLPTLGIEPVVNYNPQSEKSFDPISVINEYIFDNGIANSNGSSSNNSTIKTTEISSSGYRKGLPQENPDIDYVFTENAEAYTYTQNLREGYSFPNPNDPKINVSDVNGTNQAGIRTDKEGNITPNAYGIVVKKYQQDANGKFVAKEGQFQDTDEDFAMFIRLNEDMFSKLNASTNTKIVFPSQMALGKAALPLRFVEWLQFELQIRFNIESVIEENVNSNYEGYGLRITDARPTVRDELRSESIVYLNHSGGAVGSDSYWGEIGEKYGVRSNHYWYKNTTPFGNTEISTEDALEGQQKATIAARQMGRIAPNHQVRDERIIRNWSQVKYSDAIFAITTLLQVGDEMNYNKKALIIQGKGGTGYAIQMAINEGKPVYLYDQIKEQWYKNINGEWSESDTPTLTYNFAGIGTRNLNDSGKRAIEEVYKKTFAQSTEESSQPANQAPEVATTETPLQDSTGRVTPSQVNDQLNKSDLAESWSKKEGWSIEHFYAKVLPKIDQAWQIEFELASDQSVPAQFKGQMTLNYNGDTRPEITSTSTLDAIRKGERTATTRYEYQGKINYWKQAKVGDIIDWYNGDEHVKVVVTKPLTKLYDATQQKVTQQVLPFDGTITNSGLNKNSYTFSDGFTVDIPFALNDQQIHVLQELDKFVNDRTSQSITLSGYAGTGKTTIISIFHKYLSYLGDEPLYLAPTHRANAVTKQMNPDADVNTLHSFLGLSPSVDLDSEDFDVSTIKFEQTQFSEVEDKLLIVDESSMISDDLYEFLQKSAARGGNKIIYVGDPAQLKPVKGTDISKVFKDPNGIQLSLTKVERTGDNAILAEATRVRNGQDLTYNTSLNSKGEGVIYTQDRSEVKEYITNNINSVEYASDPLYFKILSATNKEVPIYNDLVRKILFGNKAKQTPFVEGDLLMAYSNEMRQKSFGRSSKSKKYLINNSLDYQVVKVKEIKSKSLPSSDITVDGYQLRLKDLFRGGEFDVFILDPNTSQPVIDSIVNHIDELWAKWVKARSRGDVRFAAQIISEINKFKDSFTTIAPLYNSRGAMKKNKTFDYGYAHTIHKSQGGTYNKVLVLGGTINAFSHDPQAQQQLKYVAITRAKEQVMYTAPMTVQINTNPTVTSTNNTVNNVFSKMDKAGVKRIEECK